MDFESAWESHRREHERGLVEAIFSDPESIVTASAMVGREDFRDELLGVMFELGAALITGGQFTPQRLKADLRKRGYLRNEQELSEYMRLKQGLTVHGEWHAAELARMCGVEQFRVAMAAGLEAGKTLDADIESLKSRVEAKLSAIESRQINMWSDLMPLAEKVYQKHKNILHGDDDTSQRIGTGFTSLDQLSGGYFPQQLWQIAARSYYGKTTFALAMIRNLIERENPVGCYFASYEMSNEELVERYMSGSSAVPLLQFSREELSQDQLNRVLAACLEYKSMPVLFDERPPDTVQKLAARLKLAKQDRDVRVVFVDHIQLFPTPKGTARHEFLAELVTQFKQMAKDLRLTVVLLNQLNTPEEKDGKVVRDPTDQDMRGAKAVYQSLDVSLLLHRKDPKDPKMKVKVTKAKKGIPGEFFVHFVGETQVVLPWVEPAGGGLPSADEF